MFKEYNSDRVRWNTDDGCWEVNMMDVWCMMDWRYIKKLLNQLLVRMKSAPLTPPQYVEVSDILKTSMAYNSHQEELDQIQRERINHTPIEL